MSDTVKSFLSGLLAGVIAAGGTLTGALIEMPKTSNISDVGSLIWIVGAIFGIGAAAKDWRTSLRKP